MEFPNHLLNIVREGRGVLLLGSGSSFGCVDSAGDGPPDGEGLKDMLCDRFLGGAMKDSPLTIVSELAISESSPGEVQEYIRQIFDQFHPAAFHELVSSFVWKAIATTNYDLIMERAYQRSSNPVQTLVPFVQNGESIEGRLRALDSVRFLKLHGSISRTANEDAPLILTIDQYNNHRRGRERLYSVLEELAQENPFIIVGHSLRDPDIRQVLGGLEERFERPMSYTIAPQFDALEVRLLQGKRITPIESTFEEFLTQLDKEISSPFRGVVRMDPTPELAISERFIIKDPGLSGSTHEFLEHDVEYVNKTISAEPVAPQQFYRGYSAGWSAIEQELDVRRRLTDAVLASVVSLPGAEERNNPKFVLVNGYAGSGKTVLIKRVAWDVANSFEGLSLFLRPEGKLQYESLRELCQLVDERVYIFVDRAGNRISELVSLFSRMARNPLRMTIVAAERTNEWNVLGEPMEQYIDDEFEVKYLSKSEILALLERLEKHQSLGELRRLTLEERIKAFEERHGRQLLVALHETTGGHDFEDIIANEYESLGSEQAKQIYLTVCSLNQFDAPVRAGIISRLFGISFTDFREKFFSPLELVVIPRIDKITRDYIYEARHPHVAEMLANRVLANSLDRTKQYKTILSALNLDYDSDRRAFRRMIRARSLLENVGDRDLVSEIYEAAFPVAGDDHYFLHQRAIFEIQSPDGDLRLADELLDRAKQLAPWDHSIIHSFAELELCRAEAAESKDSMESHLNRARSLAMQLTGNDAKSAAGFHTLAKGGLFRLRTAIMALDDTNADECWEIISYIEDTLQRGLQRFPGDAFLLGAESELHRLTADDKAMLGSLERAFSANPDNAFIAIRLARHLESISSEREAADVLEKAIEAGAGDKYLHYYFGKLLESLPDVNPTLMEYHLRQGFTEGDQNFEAQYRYARRLYINGRVTESRSRFTSLFEANSGAKANRHSRDPILVNGKPVVFKGTITRLESDFGFVTRDGFADTVFMHISDITEDVWGRLALNLRVEFSIGFNWKGTKAFNLRQEGLVPVSS